MKTSLPVWLKHVLGAIMVLVLLYIGTYFILNFITQSTASKAAPQLVFKSIREQSTFDTDFEYKIMDSIYDPAREPGLIVSQDPEPGAIIKTGRTIFLQTIRYSPPWVQMPGLLDRSERQAILMIQSYGFKLGWTRQQLADCNGCVIAQLINNRSIATGDSVLKGSTINLIIGQDSTAMYLQDTLRQDSVSLPFETD